MTTRTDDEADLTRLQDESNTLLLALVECAGDLAATAAVLSDSRERHGLQAHRRIAECALLRLFGSWAQHGPNPSSIRI